MPEEEMIDHGSVVGKFKERERDGENGECVGATGSSSYGDGVKEKKRIAGTNVNWENR